MSSSRSFTEEALAAAEDDGKKHEVQGTVRNASITRSHGSWLNFVERFFCDLTAKAIGSKSERAVFLLLEKAPISAWAGASSRMGG